MVFASFRDSSTLPIPTIDEDHVIENQEALGSVMSGVESPMPESLEGSLFQRKQQLGMNSWKRRYVVLNMSGGGSFSCYRATSKDRKVHSKVRQRNSDAAERTSLSHAPVFHVPSSVEWIARDIEKSSLFAIEVDGSTVNDVIENKQNFDDDDASLDSSSLVGSSDADSKRNKDNHLQYVFRCPHGAREKALWLEAFAQLNRLALSQTEPVEKRSFKFPGFSSQRISGRERSPLSAKLAREKLQLAGRGRSSTTVALNEAEMISRKVKGDDIEFTVMPSYAYPNVRFNREELRHEMKRPSSHFHDLRVPSKRGEEIGTLRVEVLQCLGLPKLDLMGETDPVVYLVCGSYAFSTDTIPNVANPMWLSKMRRACIFPLFHAYARLYVGVFDNDGEKARDDFAGRVVVDIARLRPGCTYDVMLPLRQSAHVYSRRQRGSIRLRFHLDWVSERAAMLSYLPKKVPKVQPNRSTTVRCSDETAFQNVALTVHGKHQQGHFSLKQLKATMREINFTRIMLIRLILKPQAKKIVLWEIPLISMYVFCAWMHCVYTNSVAYVPGHVLTFFLIYLWKNYAYYAMDGPGQRGFLPPTWEEMMLAVMKGTTGHTPQCIAPLDMRVQNASFGGSARSVNPLYDDDDQSSVFEGTSLKAISETFREGVPLQTYRRRLRSYKNVFLGSDAVDFLVNRGIATSRMDAVRIGRALESNYRLFEHIKKEHPFEDERLFYRFLDVSLDKYMFTTHHPRGKRVFKLLGLYDDSYGDQLNNGGHLEFPFSDFVNEYPKFTVKESLVPRLASEKQKRKMSILKRDTSTLEIDNIDEQEEDLELEALGNGSVLDELVGKPEASASADDVLSIKSDDTHSADSGNTDADVVEALPPGRMPPPPQDMDIIRKSDKKLTDELQVVKGRLHAMLLHWFNDKVYDIKDPNARFAKQSRRQDKNKKKKNAEDDIKTQLDRSLQNGQFSHSNRAVAKIGLFLEPIVGIALIYLSGIRALYNIFTWRDPILSFWVSVICPLVVIVLHLCPWRTLLFLVGFILFGPQNLILRLFLGKHISKAFSEAKPKKAAKPSEGEEEDEPYFESNIEGNSQAQYETMDPSQVHHIVVPYSPLMYQRFYDWPPEPEYARVEADKKESEVAMQLQLLRCRSHRSHNSLPSVAGFVEKDGTKAQPRSAVRSMMQKIRHPHQKQH